MSLFSGIFLVFLALKLSNHIDWTWWAVFAPLVCHILVVSTTIAIEGLKK